MFKRALATITTVAPLTGTLLSVYRIIGSFKGCPCGNSAEDFAALIANELAYALVPITYGLAIGIIAKLIHGDPTARQRPTTAGFDRAARELAYALSPPRISVPFPENGKLDTLLFAAKTANLLAFVLLLETFTKRYTDVWYFLAANSSNGTFAVVAAALPLAQLNRHVHRYLAALPHY